MVKVCPESNKYEKTAVIKMKDQHWEIVYGTKITWYSIRVTWFIPVALVWLLITFPFTLKSVPTCIKNNTVMLKILHIFLEAFFLPENERGNQRLSFCSRTHFPKEWTLHTILLPSHSKTLFLSPGPGVGVLTVCFLGSVFFMLDPLQSIPSRGAMISTCQRPKHSR